MAPSDTKLAGIGIAGETFLSIQDLEEYMARRRHAEQAQDDARQAALAQSEREQIEQLTRPIEVDEQRLADFMHRVRRAAERGDHRILILRFPSAMCRDGGQAINNSLPGWEDTLVGVPLRILTIWQEHLKPQGFRLSAEVIDDPAGMPGEVGLFCRW